MSLPPSLRVGGLTIPFDQAAAWATNYLDTTRNRSSVKPYAYPAYDLYNTEHNPPDRITDADLLAPVLLNVSVSIRTYYGLQHIRENLERALPPVTTPALAKISPEQVAELVSPIYAILDDPETRPYKVKATTLSKIVHRKRPRFLGLHDKWVQACYTFGSDAPLKLVTGRSWADYMVGVTLAIREDLVTQHSVWHELRGMASRPGNPPVSLVRLLDIIAWHAGQSPGEFATETA